MKNIKIILITSILILLTGCKYDLKLVEKGGGSMGTGVGDESGNKVTFNIHGKEYKGNYTYDDGTTIGSVNTFGTSTTNTSLYGTGGYVGGTGVNSGSGFGTVVSGKVSGQGSILTFSDDGDSIKCGFDFTSNGGTGIGVCEDSKGTQYDLLISKQ
jgi:hypothetical protein